MVHKVSFPQVQGNLGETEKKSKRKTVTPPLRLQEFESYFWELDGLHTICTPPYAREVPCNDYIIEATYMSVAGGLLEYPEKRGKVKGSESLLFPPLKHF